jgi:hypothetical protein
LFLFMVHTSLAPVLNLLHFYISTFRSVCVCPIWLFSVAPWLRGLSLLRFVKICQLSQNFKQGGAFQFSLKEGKQAVKEDPPFPKINL